MLKIHETPALVTGATRGLGRALVAELLERDCPQIYASERTAALMVFPDRVFEGVQRARRARGQQGPPRLPDNRIVPVALDLTSNESIAQGLSPLSDVGLLINNAGIAVPGGWGDDHFAEALEANTATNVTGTLAVIEDMLPTLQKCSPSAIVNIMTVWALAGTGGPFAAYAASKALLHNLTQSLRADMQVGNTGVRVAGVYAGPIDTSMTKGLDIPKASPTDVAKAIIDCLLAGDTNIYPDRIAVEFSQSYLAPS